MGTPPAKALVSNGYTVAKIFNMASYNLGLSYSQKYFQTQAPATPTNSAQQIALTEQITRRAFSFPGTYQIVGQAFAFDTANPTGGPNGAAGYVSCSNTNSKQTWYISYQCGAALTDPGNYVQEVTSTPLATLRYDSRWISQASNSYYCTTPGSTANSGQTTGLFCGGTGSAATGYTLPTQSGSFTSLRFNAQQWKGSVNGGFPETMPFGSTVTNAFAGTVSFRASYVSPIGYTFNNTVGTPGTNFLMS
jgi:hypothetical protein